MKKTLIIFPCIIATLAFLCHLQWGREFEVCNTKIESFEDGYYENIAIVTNSLYIFDREAFAERVVQKVIDNSLKDVMLSYDILGYPNGLRITVYMNVSSYKNGNSSFEITYLQDSGHEPSSSYNIKDNPEEFVLEIISH